MPKLLASFATLKSTCHKALFSGMFRYNIPPSPSHPSENPASTLMTDLTHFDESGASRMVNVGDKPVTERLARAQAIVTMLPATLALIKDRQLGKGDVLEVARLAGIMGSKQTQNLIPLCHSLGLDSAKIDFDFVDDSRIRIEAQVSNHGRTGVEMEAMTAVSITALTIYDMCKAVDRWMSIGSIELLEKAGGKSGHLKRELNE